MKSLTDAFEKFANVWMHHANVTVLPKTAIPEYVFGRALEAEFEAVRRHAVHIMYWADRGSRTAFRAALDAELGASSNTMILSRMCGHVKDHAGQPTVFADLVDDRYGEWDLFLNVLVSETYDEVPSAETKTYTDMESDTLTDTELDIIRTNMPDVAARATALRAAFAARLDAYGMVSDDISSSRF